jgi:hypothetical protein
MQTKKKHKPICPKPTPQEAQDAAVRELSERIKRLRQSAREGDAKFRKMLRLFKRRQERERIVIVSPDHCSCPPAPLWIDPAPQRPFASPQCAGLAECATPAWAM